MNPRNSIAWALPDIAHLEYYSEASESVDGTVHPLSARSKKRFAVLEEALLASNHETRADSGCLSDNGAFSLRESFGMDIRMGYRKRTINIFSRIWDSKQTMTN